MFEEPFRSEHRVHDRTLVVRGFVSEQAIDLFRDAIGSASGDYTQSLDVDLSGVGFLSSRAVGVIVDATSRSQGKVRAMAAAGTVAQHVLSVVGVPYAAPSRGSRPDG